MNPFARGVWVIVVVAALLGGFLGVLIMTELVQIQGLTAIRWMMGVGGAIGAWMSLECFRHDRPVMGFLISFSGGLLLLVWLLNVTLDSTLIPTPRLLGGLCLLEGLAVFAAVIQPKRGQQNAAASRAFR